MSLALPEMTRRRWGGLLLAAAVATFVRIMLQGLIPAGTDSGVGESIIVQAGLLIPAFTIYAFLAFCAFGYLFLIIERALPARTAVSRGLLFGIAASAIWIAYLFEPVPLGANTPFPDILAYPIADATAMILFGLLIGRLAATKGPSANDLSLRPFAPVVAVLVTFIAFRFLAYNLLHIYSSYEDRTLDTMAWVSITGLIIGLSYLLLRPGVPAATPGGRAVTFGVVVFGVLITLINFFVPLALDINTADLALRTALDIAAVTVGIFIGEAVSMKR